MKALLQFVASLGLAASSLAAAEKPGASWIGNPIVPGLGLADPHAVVYGDRVYVYAGHDFSATNTTFVMKEWWVWSSADLVNWKQEGTLKPESTNVYGPYTYKGSVLAPENVAAAFQVDKAARKYDLWHDRHGNFFTWHNQWYYICNDKSQPGRHTHFRDTCISCLHYRDNGEMAPVRLDAIGVGQYDARQPRIEAEDYFDAENAEVKEGPAGGFEVRGLGSGSRLVYPKVKNLPQMAILTFSVAAGRQGGGTMEVREDGANGKLLGTCTVSNTGGWDKYQSVSCALENKPGTLNLCLVFKGGAGELLRLDWMTFSLKAKMTP